MQMHQDVLRLQSAQLQNAQQRALHQRAHERASQLAQDVEHEALVQHTAANHPPPKKKKSNT